MSPWALGVAWALSALSLCWPLPVELGGGTLSRTLLCALPWIALAGLPQNPAAGKRVWWNFYAACLPVLAIASGLDRAAHVEVFALIRECVSVFVLVTLLALSARSARGSSLHACVWSVFVAVPAALASLPGVRASDWFGFESWFAATPLVWAARELVSQNSLMDSGWPWERDLGLIVGLVLLFGVSQLARKREVAS